ncbi:MAG TPA: hypothetical protein VFO60_08150 [Candidatus Dormibacteraeota bacterium]|nr:hypothetical protein [Candidatus Dormibacteraeota bacterium]
MPPRRNDRAAIVPVGTSGLARVARGVALAAVPGLAASLRSRQVRTVLQNELLGITRPGHPLTPAALRVERTHGAGADAADQVAVTVWFGEGPALPSLSQPHAGGASLALRLGASIIGAAAIAALTTAAARLAEQGPPQIVDARPD